MKGWNNLDIAVFLVLFAVHCLSLYEVKKATARTTTRQPKADEERRSGMQMLAMASTGGLIAVSILFAALSESIEGNPATQEFALRAFFWLALSLTAGIFVLFALPMDTTQDPRMKGMVMIPYGLQVLAVPVGGFWLFVIVVVDFIGGSCHA